ncbi:MAG: hypothetical protein ABH823_04350 [bacterium]
MFSRITGYIRRLRPIGALGILMVVPMVRQFDVSPKECLALSETLGNSGDISKAMEALEEVPENNIQDDSYLPVYEQLGALYAGRYQGIEALTTLARQNKPRLTNLIKTTLLLKEKGARETKLKGLYFLFGLLLLAKEGKDGTTKSALNLAAKLGHDEAGRIRDGFDGRGDQLDIAIAKVRPLTDELSKIKLTSSIWGLATPLSERVIRTIREELTAAATGRQPVVVEASAAECLKTGAELLAQKDFQAAYLCFRRVVQETTLQAMPTQKASAYHGYKHCYLATGNKRLAAQALAEILKLFPASVNVYEELLPLYVELGEIPNVVRALELAMSNLPQKQYNQLFASTRIVTTKQQFFRMVVTFANEKKTRLIQWALNCAEASLSAIDYGQLIAETLPFVVPVLSVTTRAEFAALPQDDEKPT